MATATHESSGTRTGSRPSRTPSPAEQTQLRRMLEQQQGFRTEQLAALGTPGTAGPFASAVDEITRTLAAGAQAAMRDVRDALARMDAGSYGRCTGCHTPLGIERLEILPQVARCMPCQRAADDPTTSSTRAEAEAGAPTAPTSATA